MKKPCLSQHYKRLNQYSSYRSGILEVGTFKYRELSGSSQFPWIPAVLVLTLTLLEFITFVTSITVADLVYILGKDYCDLANACTYLQAIIFSGLSCAVILSFPFHVV